MILIYPQNETAFTGSGYGSLPDAVSCTVTEELNGAFLLEMTYVAAGVNAEHLELRNIILCKANPYDQPDAFRIIEVSKGLAGTVEVRAQHVSYDLFGIPVGPYTAANIAGALAGIGSNSLTANPFSFTTTRSVATPFSNTIPTSARALLAGKEGSLLDVYGGEWSFFRFTLRLWLHRGQDRGVKIRYGKNMTSLDHDTEGDLYTGVYPYWKNDEGTLVTCGIVNATGTFNFTRILTMDFSDRFEEAPTALELQAAAQSYIDNSSHIAPNISLRVSFVDLAQTEEYKHLTSETVKLGDTVGIIYPNLGITASAEVNKTVYDALLDRYTSIELGKPKHSLAQTIAGNTEVLTEDGNVNGQAIQENTISREALRADAVKSTNYDGEWTILFDGSDGDHDEVSYSWKINGQIYAVTLDGPVPIGPPDNYDTGIVINRDMTIVRFYTISTHVMSDIDHAVTQVPDYIGDSLEVSGAFGFPFSGSFLDLASGEFHTAAMEITDTTARFKGEISQGRLVKCKGLSENYIVNYSGSMTVDSLDEEVYGASAYKEEDQTFTYEEHYDETTGWYDESGSLVDMSAIGFTISDAPTEGDTIDVVYSSTYSKIITLQDLRDLGLIP